MALFAFQCLCGRAFRRILPEALPEVACPACGALAARKPQGPSTLVLETIDNGLQARATVRIADADRIFKEASIQDDLENGEVLDEQDLDRIPDGELI